VHAPRGSQGELRIAGETWSFEGASVLLELPPKIVRVTASRAGEILGETGRNEVVVTLGARNGPVSLDRILADSVHFGGAAP
jgi:hypothetical protein